MAAFLASTRMSFSIYHKIGSIFFLLTNWSLTTMLSQLSMEEGVVMRRWHESVHSLLIQLLWLISLLHHNRVYTGHSELGVRPSSVNL